MPVVVDAPVSSDRMRKETHPAAIGHGGTAAVAATVAEAHEPVPAEPVPQAQQASEPVARIAGGVMAGNILSKVAPTYPADAKAAGVQGAVVLRAIISKDGDVENLLVISGPKELLASAIDAVKQWKYKPYLLNGQPTEVETTITVNYHMSELPWPPAAPNGGQSSQEIVPRTIGGLVSSPKIVEAADPEYTPEAREKKVAGSVLLRLWVDPDGSPSHVHVVRGVGYGLDEKAVAAVERYKFSPAMEDGKPVTVAINVEVNFQLF
jgi:TonB family protein